MIIANTNTSIKNQSVTVYTTKTGSKYHVDGCLSLNKSKIPISLSDAKAEKLGPCSKCHPPLYLIDIDISLYIFSKR